MARTPRRPVYDQLAMAGGMRDPFTAKVDTLSKQLQQQRDEEAFSHLAGDNPEEFLTYAKQRANETAGTSEGAKWSDMVTRTQGKIEDKQWFSDISTGKKSLQAYQDYIHGQIDKAAPGSAEQLALVSRLGQAKQSVASELQAKQDVKANLDYINTNDHNAYKAYLTNKLNNTTDPVLQQKLLGQITEVQRRAEAEANKKVKAGPKGPKEGAVNVNEDRNVMTPYLTLLDKSLNASKAGTPGTKADQQALQTAGEAAIRYWTGIRDHATTETQLNHANAQIKSIEGPEGGLAKSAVAFDNAKMEQTGTTPDDRKRQLAAIEAETDPVRKGELINNFNILYRNIQGELVGPGKAAIRKDLEAGATLLIKDANKLATSENEGALAKRYSVYAKAGDTDTRVSQNAWEQAIKEAKSPEDFDVMTKRPPGTTNDSDFAIMRAWKNVPGAVAPPGIPVGDPDKMRQAVQLIQDGFRNLPPENQPPLPKFYLASGQLPPAAANARSDSNISGAAAGRTGALGASGMPTDFAGRGLLQQGDLNGAAAGGGVLSPADLAAASLRANSFVPSDSADAQRESGAPAPLGSKGPGFNSPIADDQAPDPLLHIGNAHGSEGEGNTGASGGPASTNFPELAASNAQVDLANQTSLTPEPPADPEAAAHAYLRDRSFDLPTFEHPPVPPEQVVPTEASPALFDLPSLGAQNGLDSGEDGPPDSYITTDGPDSIYGRLAGGADRGMGGRGQPNDSVTGLPPSSDTGRGQY